MSHSSKILSILHALFFNASTLSRQFGCISLHHWCRSLGHRNGIGYSVLRLPKALWPAVQQDMRFRTVDCIVNLRR